MGERLKQEATGLATMKRTVTAWLLVVGGLAVMAAYLVSDGSGAHLELAPLFFGVAMAVVFVRLYRSRSRRSRS
jgi:Flp pilus assembly protein TadB